MNIPVFDLHCDTALKLTGRDYQAGPGLKSNQLHIDLDRASKLAGWCQCFACFTTPHMQKWYRKSPVEIFEREMDAVLANLAANADVIRQAFILQMWILVIQHYTSIMIWSVNSNQVVRGIISEITSECHMNKLLLTV